LSLACFSLYPSQQPCTRISPLRFFSSSLLCFRHCQRLFFLLWAPLLSLISSVYSLNQYPPCWPK
jgi:hypothetical protein